MRHVRLGMWCVASSCLVACLAQGPLHAQALGQQPAPRQTQADDYTSYELLAPETRQFRILYDVTATTPGAEVYLNPIRKGSVASNERVTDLATGRALPFTVVKGDEARMLGLPGAAPDAEFLRIDLARPVPAGGGEQRIRIDKTYEDPASYTPDGDEILFARSLGIRRNKVVLPVGYELVSVNTPAQVFSEDDGRVAVSFINMQPGPVALEVRGRKLPANAVRSQAARPAESGARSPASIDGPPSRVPTLAASAAVRVGDRAFQDREITYWLQPPQTHAFDISHDYTETREGVDRYVNIVRGGSTVSRPGAMVLDTGESLPVETLRGAAITQAGIDIGGPVTEASEVVVVRFPAVKAGQSTRLRITETYTDPSRYGVVDDGLVWRRAFGRPRNVVVLPDGWYLTASSVPATVDRDERGRVRLTFVNPRLDELDVLIKARCDPARVDPATTRSTNP